MKQIEESELIINEDGSIFHLHLKPEQIANDIILVGDPKRVKIVSKYFESIEHIIKNREFITHTGYYNKKKISVISTGIGTDNIDILINELDALVNIDLENRTIKSQKRKLNLIRLGTCGCIQEDIDIGSFLVSEISIGFDGLLNFYHRRDNISNLEIEKSFLRHMNWNPKLSTPYFVNNSLELIEKLGNDFIKVMTISAPGFYGPQGRELRLQIQDQNINEKIRTFRYKNKYIANYEMESSAIAGLSALLEHNAITICVTIANRYKKEFLNNYQYEMEKLIEHTLERLTQ